MFAVTTCKAISFHFVLSFYFLTPQGQPWIRQAVPELSSPLVLAALWERPPPSVLTLFSTCPFSPHDSCVPAPSLWEHQPPSPHELPGAENEEIWGLGGALGGRQLSAPCSEADVAWLMSAAPHRLRNLRCCQISVSQHLHCSQTSKKSFQKRDPSKNSSRPLTSTILHFVPCGRRGGEFTRGRKWRWA